MSGLPHPALVGCIDMLGDDSGQLGRTRACCPIGAKLPFYADQSPLPSQSSGRCRDRLDRRIPERWSRRRGLIRCCP
jgi:hypothetical protein